MPLIYSIDNFVTKDCDYYSKSEDPIYLLDYLYNERPSLPYRTTGLGVVGNPEYVCVDFGSDKDVTLCCVFNHNYSSMVAAGDELRLKFCTEGCPGTSGACDWDNPDCEFDLQPRIVADFNDLWARVNCVYPSGHTGVQFCSLEMIDQNNAATFLEIGELWLGQWEQFSSSVHLQPGRVDGPQFFMGNQQTYWGQDWSNYYSEAQQLNIDFVNLNNAAVVDEIHVFLRRVQRANGRFVIIPDTAVPFAFYVQVMNLGDFATRFMYGCGSTREARRWTLQLKTLTKGIALL